MASLVREETRRLRRMLKVALGAALAAGQVALPFACGGTDASGDGGAGARTSADSTTSTGSAGAGGSGGGDAGPDHQARDGKVSCDPTVFIPDGAHDCEKFVHHACGLPEGLTYYPNCYLGKNECTQLCNGYAFYCFVSGEGCVDGSIVDATPPEGIDLECAVCLSGDGAVGRIPAGLVARRRGRGVDAGSALARAAELEAASVHAFRRLAAELVAHGAPRSLVRAAARAEVDESRHARTVARLARREGGAAKRPRIRPTPARGLEAIAIENAVEGRVRETFGALVATFQAARAEDAEIRRAYATIAAEETRHAALASLVHRWVMRKVGPASRRRILEAERAAVASLRRAPSSPASPTIGMPSPEEHRRLVAAFLATRAAPSAAG